MAKAISLNVSESQTITVKAERGSSVTFSRTVDPSTWTTQVLEACLVNGISQKLRDATANGKTLEEKEALIDKLIASMDAGNVRAPRQVNVDPIERKAIELVLKALHNAHLAKGGKVADFSAADWKAEAKTRVTPEITAKVRALVEMESEIDVEL